MSCLIIVKIKGFFKSLSKGICNKDTSFGKRLRELEEQVQNLTKYCNEKDSDSPVVVEQLYIERIIVDKVEYNNNFGTIGIKDLSGSLNIGANYGLGSYKSAEKKQQQNGKPSAANNDKNNTGKNNSQGQGPKCNMNFKETKSSG